MRYAVYGLLLLLYALHTDLWLWNDPRRVLGLPVGITYHLLWTFVVAGAYALAIRYAWPEDLEQAAEGGANGVNLAGGDPGTRGGSDASGGRGAGDDPETTAART